MAPPGLTNGSRMQGWSHRIDSANFMLALDTFALVPVTPFLLTPDDSSNLLESVVQLSSELLGGSVERTHRLLDLGLEGRVDVHCCISHFEVCALICCFCHNICHHIFSLDKDRFENEQ